MLDPSLLLYSDSLEVRESLQDASQQVFVPQSFQQLIETGELAYRVAQFLAPRAHRRPTDNLVERSRWILDEPLVGAWAPDTARVSTRRMPELPDAIPAEVRNIWLDEWLFLQTESWLASRIREPFDSFVNGGAVAIQLGRKAFDRLAARTLKIPSVEDVPTSLAPGQRLRAVAKWTAVAVSGGAAGAIHPALAGPAAGTAAGFFLLLDP
jgi:hypothetical protein